MEARIRKKVKKKKGNSDRLRKKGREKGEGWRWGIVRAVGTFLFAKRDVNRENKRRNEKDRKRDLLAEEDIQRGREQRTVGTGWGADDQLLGETRKSKHAHHHNHQEAAPNIGKYSHSIPSNKSLREMSVDAAMRFTRPATL